VVSGVSKERYEFGPEVRKKNLGINLQTGMKIVVSIVPLPYLVLTALATKYLSI
jgi:hypothetical protein